MMKLNHLVPVKIKFTKERYDDITDEDCHPTIDEIEKSYDRVFLSKGFDFRCGDVINISSESRDLNLYYLVARDGLELIGE